MAAHLVERVGALLPWLMALTQLILLSSLYSIVLTKASFLHRDYLTAFQQLVPETVLEEIDRNRNGEDIAMAHVVAQLSRAPSVWVKVTTTNLPTVNTMDMFDPNTL